MVRRQFSAPVLQVVPANKHETTSHVMPDLMACSYFISSQMSVADGSFES
jgi:hypothetical protein